MAFNPVCDKCGRRLHWNMVVEDLWRCPGCKNEVHQEHPTCAQPSCGDWADTGAQGYCWYHAAHHGIHPEPSEPRNQPNEIIKAEPPDFSKKTCYPNFPKSAEEGGTPARKVNGNMGRGEHKGPPQDYELCHTCGMPHVRQDGELEAKCENRANHQKRTAIPKPSWPSGYEEHVHIPEDYERGPSGRDSGGEEGG